MTEQEIQKILTEALVNLFEIDESKITPETHLYQDLEIDSIDAIDLIDHIKRQTGYKLQAEDFRNVRTVADVIEAVKKISAQ
ncbi:acyl carrier protein [Bibersteinia trehalosi]|uniref:Acyl carrier protein n=1 Tax=Bibersteinia trehalosi TaxID=47735 RepID=A0A3R8LG85_BIBTR|nr:MULTISPECIES: acyl carrier protein [Pasteurellaceae]EPY99008.1 acyl carrier protein [Mannheimia haemolytica D35]MDW0616696.1 acyl carrier protein [Mannheimia haemolytica]MDW1149260.1 acyl carrier protein [Mannheimia haemolytica]MDW1159612.1 acyl carrier protein [Mannheimia haemolytica]NBB67164.1 acyl carrier protein [Mannheimia haemolytica]